MTCSQFKARQKIFKSIYFLCKVKLAGFPTFSLYQTLGTLGPTDRVTKAKTRTVRKYEHVNTKFE